MGGDALHAGEANAQLGPLLGWHSLLLIDGAHHLEERRLLMPPFHGERMQAYAEVMRDITDRAIDAWPRGRVFRFHGEMQAITLDVILRTVFGFADDGAGRRLRERLQALVGVAANPLWLVPWLRFDLANALISLGRMDEAAVLLRENVARGLSISSSYRALVDTQKFTSEPSELELILSRLKGVDLARRDGVELHHAAGKIMNDQRRWSGPICIVMPGCSGSQNWRRSGRPSASRGRFSLASITNQSWMKPRSWYAMPSASRTKLLPPSAPIR